MCLAVGWLSYHSMQPRRRERERNIVGPLSADNDIHRIRNTLHLLYVVGCHVGRVVLVVLEIG